VKNFNYRLLYLFHCQALNEYTAFAKNARLIFAILQLISKEVTLLNSFYPFPLAATAIEFHHTNEYQRSDCQLSLLQIPPTPDELGNAAAVFVDELADTSVVVFRVDGTESRVATIVVRGSTDSYMDDIERTIDDGVNTFKGIIRVSLVYTCSDMLAVNLRESNQLICCN
jgi:hypothetical protein